MALVKIALDGRRRAGALTFGLGRADVRASLDGGLPLRDSAVDEVYAGGALEHVDNFVDAMEEVWRVSKPGAFVHLRLPHASSPWATSRDPRHQRQYTIETFEYFSPHYRRADCPSRATFEIEKSRLLLTARNGPARGRGLSQGTLSRVLESVANRSRGMQYRWERWLGNLIGFDELEVTLSVVKEWTPPESKPARARRSKA